MLTAAGQLGEYFYSCRLVGETYVYSCRLVGEGVVGCLQLQVIMKKLFVILKKIFAISNNFVGLN